MNRRIAVEQFLGWSGFVMSSLFILALAFRPFTEIRRGTDSELTQTKSTLLAPPLFFFSHNPLLSKKSCLPP